MSKRVLELREKNKARLAEAKLKVANFILPLPPPLIPNPQLSQAELERLRLEAYVEYKQDVALENANAKIQVIPVSGETFEKTFEETSGKTPFWKFIKINTFKINTSRIILEAFNPGFITIDTRVNKNLLLVNLVHLEVPEIVDAIKRDRESLVLIYSEKINLHKKFFEEIKENMFAGYQSMMKEKLIGTPTQKLLDDIEHVGKTRTQLFSRMFLMSVQKKSGFDFPMINPLLLFYSSIIHGHAKISEIECKMYDPDFKKRIPLKKDLVSFNGDEGETVYNYLKKNFTIKKKKIYFISNEFYKPTKNSTPSYRKYELLKNLTGLEYSELNKAVGEKSIIEKEKEEHRKKVLLDEAPIYQRRVKKLVDMYYDGGASAKAFNPKTITGPSGYKLCHNIINYLDYISGGSKSKTLFRFLEIIPPAYFVLDNDYEKITIQGFLENHPSTVDNSWFGTELTYNQTERLLLKMITKKAKICDLFDEITEAFSHYCDTVDNIIMPSILDKKEAPEPAFINLYIFIGEKYTGKSFMAKKFVEYLDDLFSGQESPATIVSSYKKDIVSAIINGKTEIVVDSSALGKEYNRRTLTKTLKEKLAKVSCKINYCFINVHIINTFKEMLMKYTRSAFPMAFSAIQEPKGYYHSNIKSSNVIDITNCYWIDASKEELDFDFEIGRQIH